LGITWRDEWLTRSMKIDPGGRELAAGNADQFLRRPPVSFNGVQLRRREGRIPRQADDRHARVVEDLPGPPELLRGNIGQEVNPVVGHAKLHPFVAVLGRLLGDLLEAPIGASQRRESQFHGSSLSVMWQQ